MEIREVGPSNGKSTDQFIDRSKVRILLCDNDSKSSQEVFSLLCKCSYQVTSVKSARQVVDALNAERSEIDIILSEVDLPTKKGFKLLKYIMRDEQLQRIPVIMMSTQDEVSLVVKCLRLGAADFLVKPLRTNELLNLWTHMWRRRRMLGLAEKNIVSYDFDLAASDHSENSTTLFSDDTDDKSRRSVNPEISFTMQQEEECNKVTSDAVPANSFDCRSTLPALGDRRTGFVPFSKKGEPFLKKSEPFPKRRELKIGECSAFFTYVKTGAVESNCQTVVDVEGNAAKPSRPDDKLDTWNGHVINGNMTYENGDVWENNSHGEDFPSSTSVPDSTSMERSCTPPVTVEFMQNKSNDEGLSEVHMQPKNGKPHFDVSTLAAHAAAYPYFMSGVMNQFMMPSSAHANQKDLQNHGSSTMMPHYNHVSHSSSQVPGMAPFTYYPLGVCLPQGQTPANHQVPSFGNSFSSEAKLSKVNRREAALIKFRQKRKERCFDKKIRYVNRKKLAERRPRVRGQFVRKVNGVTVDLNGDPSADLYEEDEDEPNSSPEDDTF
ncbi:hypothetical protein SOVF_188550 [Spinacia oleracea]|uniref:Two-component response regulator-like APRR1 n=1 Tax=Spinacia oleracea TaxID=3562 RepID=A0A9R0K7V2_SPIOL|nr:two-component response regulator-like APRR1 [Spinacia oleracea]KNA05633.1 hypothetical protein SOVF_188550 [Spinacia oleracea]